MEDTYQEKQSIAALNVPTRETEINRELNDSRQISKQLIKLTEELTQRLASVISPRDGEQTLRDIPEAHVSTPLGTNIKEINMNLETAKRTISFILSGLEL